MVTHAFNSNTGERSKQIFLSSRTAWPTSEVPDKPELYRKTLSQKQIPDPDVFTAEFYQTK